MMKTFALIVATVLLAGCSTTGTPVETRYKTVTVVKRGPCPDPVTYAKIKASRPVPLRNQARPKDGTERVARTAAQLGLYEAEGKWADQASAALDRCQTVTDDTEVSEGLADSP